MIEQFASRWLVIGEPSAIEWIELQSPRQIRDRLLKRMALAQAQRDPQEVAQFVVARIPPGAEQDDAVQQ